MGGRPHMGLRVDTLLRRGFRAGTCKDRLKDTVKQIKQARNQIANSAKQLRMEIAQLLRSRQDSHACRLEAENLVRIQNMMGAYDLIDHYCELVISRMQIIDAQRNCPVDVKEAVASLIFAAPRCSDLKYLPHVSYMFEQKYGMEFTAAIEEVRPDSGVNTQIIELLSTSPATGQTKLQLMHKIAAENNIEWKDGENEFTKPPEDLPASPMESMQSRNIAPADSGEGNAHPGIPAGDSIEVSHLTEYGQPQATQVETIWDTDSMSEMEFQDAEGSVQNSIEVAESKMGFQDAVEAAFPVMALNGESTLRTHASDPHEDMPSSRSDEVTRMPWQRFYEDGAYSGSRRRQYESSASTAQAAIRLEDHVSNIVTVSPPPSKMPFLMSDEVPRIPAERFYEDGAYFRSGRRQYKDLASAVQAALPHEESVPNAGTESPPPPEMPTSKSDEVSRMPSLNFYNDGAYRGSGTRRHYKDFASAAQVAFESAALAAEAAQAAMHLARFFDQEPGSFKYSSSSNNLGAKAAATETPEGRREFDSKLFESNVNPKKVTGDQKTHPEIESQISDAGTIYLDSFPSAVFMSARNTEERSNGKATSSSDDNLGRMSNPTWGSKHVPRLETLPAKSGSGYGDLNHKLLRNSEGSDNDAMIKPVSLWNRRVAGACLAKRTEDTCVERPQFDDEEDVPNVYGEHFGRNSLENMKSGSGEFFGSSSLLIGTERGFPKHSSFSVGTFEEGGGAKPTFEHRRLREDSRPAGSEDFSDKSKFNDEVNGGLQVSGIGQFARVSSGHDYEKAEAADAPAPSLASEAGRRSEAKPRCSSSSNVAEDIQCAQKRRGGYGKSQRTRWAQKRPLVSPPKAEQHDEATAALATSQEEVYRSR